MPRRGPHQVHLPSVSVDTACPAVVAAKGVLTLSCGDDRDRDLAGDFDSPFIWVCSLEP